MSAIVQLFEHSLVLPFFGITGQSIVKNTRLQLIHSQGETPVSNSYGQRDQFIKDYIKEMRFKNKSQLLEFQHSLTGS